MTTLNLNWFKKAGIRAIKTASQVAISTIGTSLFVSQIDWKAVVSATAVATLLSFLYSLKGLPEIRE